MLNGRANLRVGALTLTTCRVSILNKLPEPVECLVPLLRDAVEVRVRVREPFGLEIPTDSVIHSAHFEVPLITMPNYRDVGFVDGEWTIPPAAPRFSARIIFLSGGGAISYAESTLGVVEAYKLGDVVGEASAGTNGNVNPFTLPGGYSVSWTGMLVQKRDGTPHHGVGVRPTVPVSPTVAGLRAGRDEVLERAIALVTRPLTP